MKRIIAIIGLIVFTALPSYSQLAIGLFAGSSTPNDKINDVYNEQTIKDIDEFVSLGTQTGYHFFAKLRYPVSESFTFVGGVGWHRFPETFLDVILPDSDEPAVRLSTVQNAFPISAGLNLYLTRSLISVYGVGELSYNYILNSVDVYKGKLSVPINKSPKDSRVGFGLGAGIDLDLFIMEANIEAKYNMLNLIGKLDNEPAKTFFSVSVGVFFGKTKKAEGK